MVDIELGRPLPSLVGLESYGAVRALVRWHGTPLGTVEVPVVDGKCAAHALGRAVLEHHTSAILRHLVTDRLAVGLPARLSAKDLIDVEHPRSAGPTPLVTVAVCTRDRPAGLALCLDALGMLDYPGLDLLVVDNAPTGSESESLVRTRYAQVRYVQEARPGLDWARNRAIGEARGEIVAFIDDDAIADPGWIAALARVFAENPDVMAVTGLVVPDELETEAQAVFERSGGFGRGYTRRWIQLDESGRWRWSYLGTGQFGTGTNMAYRRIVFDTIGSFDPALDLGTVTHGGGDLEMFFRVLAHGHLLVYEPAAIVRHRHRREYAELRTQFRNNGIGFSAYVARSAAVYRSERRAFFKLWRWWLWRHHLRQLVASAACRGKRPADLILAELGGSLLGFRRYQRARAEAERFGDQPVALPFATPALSRRQDGGDVAERIIDVSKPLQPIDDVVDQERVGLVVTRSGRVLGRIEIANHGHPISVARLRDAIVARLWTELLEADGAPSALALRAEVLTALRERHAGEIARPLPASAGVSVVLATLDRPDDLRVALRHLQAQTSPRALEIIVVDNDPASGLTAPVVAEFPGVVLIAEERRGLAYARNAGFVAAKGEIIVTTDDDVVMPPDWLEKLVAPFVRSEVMTVTGLILPFELQTRAHRLFETYGGLGRGYEPRDVGPAWFASGWRATPTWELGATANAAFRACIFRDPAIGLMDEALGPGTPTGVGEDTYLFYRVLKAGHTLVYEPTAYVWHKHRRDMRALRRQLYAYSKGHVAYHLTTLLRDRDRRALVHLGWHLPRWRLRQIRRWLLRRGGYPLRLILVELAGNLVGPWSLWRSRQRVGRSRPSRKQ